MAAYRRSKEGLPRNWVPRPSERPSGASADAATPHGSQPFPNTCAETAASNPAPHEAPSTMYVACARITSHFRATASTAPSPRGTPHRESRSAAVAESATTKPAGAVRGRGSVPMRIGSKHASGTDRPRVPRRIRIPVASRGVVTPKGKSASGAHWPAASTARRVARGSTPASACRRSRTARTTTPAAQAARTAGTRFRTNPTIGHDDGVSATAPRAPREFMPAGRGRWLWTSLAGRSADDEPVVERRELIRSQLRRVAVGHVRRAVGLNQVVHLLVLRDRPAVEAVHVLVRQERKRRVVEGRHLVASLAPGAHHGEDIGRNGPAGRARAAAGEGGSVGRVGRVDGDRRVGRGGGVFGRAPGRVGRRRGGPAAARAREPEPNEKDENDQQRRGRTRGRHRPGY